MPKYDPLEYWTERGKYYQAQYKHDSKKQIQEEALLSSLKSLSFSSVLEIGCGFGRITKLLISNFPTVDYTAVDLSPDQIKNAKKYTDSKNVQFLVCDIQSFNSEKKYDLVIACEVLLHIKPEEIGDVIKKLLTLSNRYLVHVDWYENNPPSKVASHNFMHNYPQIYQELGKDMHSIPIRKKSLFGTEDAKQHIFVADA